MRVCEVVCEEQKVAVRSRKEAGSVRQKLQGIPPTPGRKVVRIEIIPQGSRW